MGEVANRLRACRERAYLAAPLDDLQHALHDLVVEIDPLVARVSSLEAEAARAARLERELDDVASERDELESRVESLVAQVQQLKSKEAP